jgi:branched-chain amino acid transport system permease protein
MAILLTQAVISGLLLGLVYALIGIGMNLIYGVMRVVNFAHGEFMLLAAYICYWLSTSFGLNPLQSLVVVLPGFFLGGLAVYYLVVPRLLLSEDPEVMSFLAFFGISLIITSVILLIWNADPRGVPFPFHKVSVSIGQLFLPLGRIIAGGFSLIGVAGLLWLLHRTYLGKAIRAIIQNREAVSILGINPHRISAFSLGLGLLLVALAGSVVVLSFPSITPFMGGDYTVVAFVVIVLGGLGNPLGALVGGIVFGLAEDVSAVFMPTSLSPVVAFVILIVMILLRPEGLLGRY